MLKSNFLNCFLLIFCFNTCGCVLAPELHDSDESTDVSQTLLLEKEQKIAQQYLTSLDDVKEDWIDPFRMLTPASSSLKTLDKFPIKRPELNTDEQPVFVDFRNEHISKNSLRDAALPNVETPFCSKERHNLCVLDSIYLARWFKKLLSKIDIELEPEPISLTIPLDSDVVNYLKDLSLDKELQKSKLDEFVFEMISRCSVERKSRIDWLVVREDCMSAVQIAGIVLITCICVYVIRECFISRPLMTLSCAFVLSSIVWHWVHLYQQKLAHKHSELSSMQIPNECRKHDFGFFEQVQHYFKSYFSGRNECQKYYEALMVDPFWEVSISMAASEAVTAVLFQPLSFASRSINSALKQLFDGLPLLVAVPLVAFLFLLIIIMCNYRIRFPFFMGSLEPHVTPRGSQAEEVKSASVLKRIENSIFARETETKDKKQLQTPTARIEDLVNSDCSTQLKLEQKPQNSDLCLSKRFESNEEDVFYSPMYTDVNDENSTDCEAKSEGGSSSEYEVLSTDNEQPCP